jgi:hypothetical protein
MTRALTIARCAESRRRMHRSLHQDSLQRAVHLRRDEIDLRLLQQIAAGVVAGPLQPHAHLAGALGGNVDVGFEILVLIHGGQHGGGSKRSRPHAPECRPPRRQTARGRCSRPAALPASCAAARPTRNPPWLLAKACCACSNDIAAGDAGLKELALPLDLRRVVVVERLLLPLGGRAAESTVACWWQRIDLISTWPAFTWSPECTRSAVSRPPPAAAWWPSGAT